MLAWKAMVAAALVTSALANDNTHINNLSSKDVCGTTSYVDGELGVGKSKFIERKIPAQNSAVDTYSSSLDASPNNSKFRVKVELWVLGQGEECDRSTGKHDTISVHSDVSVTLKDGDNEGVDVYDVGKDNTLTDKAFTISAGTGLCKAVGKGGTGQAGAYPGGEGIPLDVQGSGNNLPIHDALLVFKGDGTLSKEIDRTDDDKNVHSGIGTSHEFDAGLDAPIIWWADFEAGGTDFESCKLSYKDQIEVKGEVTDGPGANIPLLVSYLESICTVEFEC